MANGTPIPEADAPGILSELSARLKRLTGSVRRTQVSALKNGHEPGAPNFPMLRVESEGIARTYESDPDSENRWYGSDGTDGGGSSATEGE